MWLFGNGWVANRFEQALSRALHRQGLDLKWESSTWDPWRGLHLTELRLTRHEGDRLTLAELGHLNLSLPLSQVFSSDGRMTRWTVNGSDVILHDNEGPVKLRNVYLDLEASMGKVIVKRITSANSGLKVDLNGSVAFKSSGNTDEKPLELRLSAVRSVLSTLDFHQAKHPFNLTGNFTVDLHDAQTTWKTNLSGEGQDLEWKGVRWKEAKAHAVITSDDMKLEYDLRSANGSTRGKVTRANWKKSPFVFKGELSDKAGRTNTYHGDYHRRVLTLEHLVGNADLVALSQDAPALDAAPPESLQFGSFPNVEIKKFVLDSSDGKPAWKVASLIITADEKVTFTLKEKQVEATGVSLHASHDGSGWIIRDSKANVFGGSVTASGRYEEGTLNGARVDYRSIRLQDVKQLAGKPGKRASRGVLSGSHRGTLDFSGKRAEGTGSVRLDNAPVLEVPLLDQVYDIFATLIPGVKRSSDGRFEANYKANDQMIDVTRFTATGGTLTVSAVGKVNLKKHTVSGRARGKLTGLPGLVTSPLSRLLEMDVEGTYDRIRVKPLGPAKLASNTASGTVGVVVDTIEETGKVTGTVLTEGVKLPFRLLDRQKDRKRKD